MKNKKKSLVNTKKLFIIPMSIIFIVIMILGIASIQFSRNIIKEQLKIDGVIIAQQITKTIDLHQRLKQTIVDDFEHNASNIGAYVLANNDIVSSDFLHTISTTFDVDEIYYYSPEGRVVYSATSTYVGWQAQKGDPIYNFMTSGLTTFHEEIREGTDNDEWYKFSYFRGTDGFFVQVGYYLENFTASIQTYELQRIVEDVVKDSGIFYALITDTNLVEIADSDPEDIGADWSDDSKYQNALLGNPSTDEWYYPLRKEKVLEITVPLYIDNKIAGVLAIGQSMESINEIVNINLSRVVLLLFFTGIILTISLRLTVFNPLQKLGNSINQIDLAKSSLTKIPVNPKDPFLGVNESFNSLLDKIETHLTEINRINSELHHAANHDMLSGMRNRRALMEYISKSQVVGEEVAFCMLDLNSLKEINDLHGHVMGDMVITTVAQRLNQLPSYVESFRFGGDEFFLIIKDSNDRLIEILTHIIESVCTPISIDEQKISISCCIGVSLYPNDGINAEDLIRKADIAMYSLKKRKEIGFLLYAASMDDLIQYNDLIYKDLLNAIETNDFQLLYQPIIETSSKEVVSFEALLRMKKSMISPNIFIPIAEEKGLIRKMTNLVINHVFSQLKVWEELGYQLRPISINISPNHFVDETLYNFLVEQLNHFEIDPQLIELEITEEVLIENKDSVVAFITKYHDIGIEVSLDDFGSGYSSLNYLTLIPFDKIKLDKSIIDKYLTENKFLVIRSIVEIAHELGLPIVAEGVESQEQYDILVDIGCDQVQGYLFSKPVDEIAIEQKYLKKK